MRSTVLERIPVGVVVERRSARSAWAEHLWCPVLVLAGKPSTLPWTPIDSESDKTLFYAGDFAIELHRTETTNYRDNLQSDAPALWVVLRPKWPPEHPYEIVSVTADPAEGEAFTDAGNDLVGVVPMPQVVVEAIDRFIAEHHVERPFVKRRRERAEPAAGRDSQGRKLDE